jgi:hypothetical protein
MTKQGLHRSDIGSFFYQTRRKTMSEGMRTYLFLYPGKFSISSHDFLYCIPAQVLSLAISGKAGKEMLSIIVSEV